MAICDAVESDAVEETLDESIQVLQQLLQRDARVLSEVAASLWGMVGQRVTKESLWWMQRLLGARGPVTLLSVLRTADVLVGDPPLLAPDRLASAVMNWSGACRAGRAEVAGIPEAVEFVCTLPPEVVPPGVRPLSTLHVVRRLIRLARREVVLCAPYFDTWAMASLIDDLRGAAWRRVTMIVVTHGLGEIESPNAQAMALLCNELAGAPHQIQIRDAATVAGPGGMVHAKLVLADRQIGLATSANLTRGGLERHLEVGVVLRGAAVETLASLLVDYRAARSITNGRNG